MRNLRLTGVLLALFACGGCGERERLFETIGVAPAHLGQVARNVGEVRLRYKRADGQRLRYDTFFRFTSRGAHRVSDDVRVVVYQECLGRTGQDPERDFDKVVLLWREIERRRREILKNGRAWFVTAVSRGYPPISEAFQIERREGRELQYFAMDDRGLFAITPKARRYTISANTLPFLLPVLPKGPVRVGETWEIRLPAYVGPQAYMLNHEKLTASMRLSGLYRHEGRLLAFIDFKHAFRFDSTENADRFNDAYNSHNRLFQTVTGSGRAVFSVDEGRIVYLSGQSEIYKEGSQLRVTTGPRESRGEKKGKPRPEWETRRVTETVTYYMRLMDETEPLPTPSQAGRE